MSLWIDDSELFLRNPYNGPTETWRCKNMTASVPLKATDFTEKTTVGNQYHLVGVGSRWNKRNYDDLLNFISENNFLVNCKGEMFVENFPFTANRNIDTSKVVYLRVYDAIKMGKYGIPVPPKVDIIKLPFRKVKYLDSNPVKDALVEDQDPPIIVVPTRPKFDPSWMNGNWESNWVGIYELKKVKDSSYFRDGDKIEVTRAGFRFGDDNTTNVRNDYFYGVRWLSSVPTDFPGLPFPMMAVAGLGDRLAQARFDPWIWGMFNNNGAWYPIKTTDGIPYEGIETKHGPPWPPR